MFPLRRLAIRAETTVVVVCENGLTIRTRNLSAKTRRRLRILQRVHEWPEPVCSLRRRIGVDKNAELRFRQPHSLIHHPAGIVFLRRDLDEVRRLRGTDQFLRAVRRAGINHDEFPVLELLCCERGQRAFERPRLIERTHDDADEWVAHRLAPFVREINCSTAFTKSAATLSGA